MQLCLPACDSGVGASAANMRLILFQGLALMTSGSVTNLCLSGYRSVGRRLAAGSL